MICISVGMLVECKVASPPPTHPPLMPGSRKKRRRLLFCKPLPAHSTAEQSTAEHSRARTQIPPKSPRFQALNIKLVQDRYKTLFKPGSG